MNTIRIALVFSMSLVSVAAFAQAEGGPGAGGTMGSISTPAGHTTGDKGTDHVDTNPKDDSKPKAKKKSKKSSDTPAQ
jgi:hypothetical protein